MSLSFLYSNKKLIRFGRETCLLKKCNTNFCLTPKSFLSYVNVNSTETPSENEKLHLGEFDSWIKRQATKVNPNIVVEWRKNPNQSWTRGVFSKKAIPKDTQIIIIPPKLIINTKRISQEPKFEKTLPQLNQLDPSESYIPLIISLIHEYSLHEKSELYPWIRVLPKEYANFFTSDSSSLFQGDTREFVHNLSKQVFRLFWKTGEIFNKHPQIFHPGYYSRENFHWGLSALLSRSFTFEPNKPILAPLLDFFNQPLRKKYQNVKAHPDASSPDHITVTALRNIKKGEELLIDYGHKSNSSLLACYGFILENETDFPIFSLKGNLDSDKLPLFEYLKANKLITNYFNNESEKKIYFSIPFYHTDKLPKNLLPVFRVLALNRQNYRKKSTQEDNQLIKEFMIPQLLQVLKEYPTTIEQDKQLEAKLLGNNYHKAIISLRKREKQTLFNVIQLLQKSELTEKDSEKNSEEEKDSKREEKETKEK